VLAYLSRYTHRVAISNNRLIALGDKGVTFRWKDYRVDGHERQKIMTLTTGEFIRRFLSHVLPQGFHRIRHYGLFASGTRADNVAPSPRTARRAGGTVQGRGYQLRQGQRTACASLPVLRWPHDRHRDLRARRLAARPAGGILNRDQDRHVMIAAVRQHRKSAHQFRRPSTGSQSARRHGNFGYRPINKSTLNAGSAHRGRPIKRPSCSIASAKRVQRTSHAHRQPRNPHSV